MARRLEQALHISAAAFLLVALPDDVPWTTIGHGGGGKARGAFLKAMGVKPGWPDIVMLLPPSARLVGFELKVKGGRVKPEQKAVHDQIRSAGGLVFVVYSLEELEGSLRGLGIDLGASVMPGGAWKTTGAAA